MPNFRLTFFERLSFLTSSVVLIDGGREKEKVIHDMLSAKRCIVVSFLNYHAVNLAIFDASMMECLIRSNYLFRDGVGVEKFLEANSFSPGINMNGTDLIPLILEKNESGSSRPVIILGGDEERCKLASKNLKESGVNVIDCHHGYNDNGFYLNLLSKYSTCDPIIVLGMGMPRQEKLAIEISNKFADRNFLIVSGGAIVDRLSGDVKRASDFFVKNKLEWLYRFCKEPARLFKRICLGGPFFVFYSIVYTIKNRICFFSER
ncbi:WecB/TagA/CpsF family glycosyltransferase [Halomonas sp. CS7]|uniref:WecB/TagA/CpsF family glycosyltransferase n=1 Tax=Halomonas pelophila TaxID=3151122 RepID=A0ABV1N701_9GAMM